MDPLTKIFMAFMLKVRPLLEQGNEYKLLNKELLLLDDLKNGFIPGIYPDTVGVCRRINNSYLIQIHVVLKVFDNRFEDTLLLND